MRNYEQMVINTINALIDVYDLDLSVMVDKKGWHIKLQKKPFMTCKNGKECFIALTTIFNLYKAQRGA